MANKKLGRTPDQRKAILRGLITALIKYGRVETTQMRAKEAQRMAEKLITKAIRSYDETVEVTKTVAGASTTVSNDSADRLAARRAVMEYVYEIPEDKLEKETKYEYRQRTSQINHPLVEKVFREIAPKYAERAKNSGQGGGYTRIIKVGKRRGDGTEMALLEFVD